MKVTGRWEIFFWFESCKFWDLLFCFLFGGASGGGGGGEIKKIILKYFYSKFCT